jgi:hypothetical protein
MWVKQLFYLGVLEQLICMCLPYGFVGLWPVGVLNIFVWAEVCCMAVGHHGLYHKSTLPVREKATKKGQFYFTPNMVLEVLKWIHLHLADFNRLLSTDISIILMLCV